MTTSLELEIRYRVAAVLRNESTLGDFYRWFVPSTWQVEHDDDPEVIRLIHRITHLFSELSAGDISPREFKRDLALTASTYMATATPWNWATTASVTTTANWNDIIEDGPTAFVLERRRAEAVAS